jgi:predicted PurR-regulated permease PerM
MWVPPKLISINTSMRSHPHGWQLAITVPYIGPLLATLPAVLIAFVESPILALWVIVLFVVIQQIESFLISPLAYQRAVKLPPVLTITTFFVFGVLFGFLGLIAAAPLTAVMLRLLKTLYVEDVLGDAA